MNDSKLSPATVAHIAILKSIIETYTVGVSFRLDSPGYSKKPYLIEKVNLQDGYIVADIGNGVKSFLDFTAIEFYQRRKTIRIVEPKLSDAAYADFADYVASADEALRNEVGR